MSKEHKSFLTVLDDLSAIKSNVPQLQATFNILMAKTPTRDRYEYLSHLTSSDVPGEAASIVYKVQALIQTPQTKVSVRLKELYDMKKLPMLAALSKIGFKLTLPEQERELGAFLDAVPTEEEIVNKDESRGRDAPKLSVDYFSYPPTLPVISNKLLLIRVTTDKSYRQASDFIELTSEKYTNSHNAKLALRGRVTMELILWDLLDEKFPNMYEKDLLAIRDRLMSLEVLAKFAFGYSLVDVMKYNLSVDADDETKMEVCANIFLAYIAALEMDGYDFKDIKLWLKILYQPLISELSEWTTPLAKVAFVEFESLLKLITNVNRYPQSIVKFEILEIQKDPFIVQIIVGDDREILGVGVSSTSFDDAKDRAVLDIMDDQGKVVRIFSILKHHYLRTRNGSRIESVSVLGPILTNDMAFQQMTPTRTQVNYVSAAPLYGRSILPSAPSSQGNAPYVTRGSRIPSSNQVMDAQPHDQNQAMIRYSQQSPPSQPMYTQQQLLPYDQQGYAQSLDHGRYSPKETYTPLTERRDNNQSSDYHSENCDQQDYELQQPYETIPLSHREVDMRARSDLYAVLKPLQLKAEYKVTHEGTVHHAVCSCNRIDLGAGIDTSKQKATQKSAMAALSNRNALIKLGVVPRN